MIRSIESVKTMFVWLSLSAKVPMRVLPSTVRIRTFSSAVVNTCP